MVSPSREKASERILENENFNRIYTSDWQEKNFQYLGTIELHKARRGKQTKPTTKKWDGLQLCLFKRAWQIKCHEM